MTTIQTTAIVGDDRRMSIQLPPEVTPGAHRVTVTIETSPAAVKNWTVEKWPVHDAGLVNPSDTMSREDMYGDDGR